MRWQRGVGTSARAFLFFGTKLPRTMRHLVIPAPLPLPVLCPVHRSLCMTHVRLRIFEGPDVSGKSGTSGVRSRGKGIRSCL